MVFCSEWVQISFSISILKQVKMKFLEI